jgi:NAD(P)H dehydrogenase (quinone)
MKIAIIYQSKSGNTKKIAEIIGEGIKTAGDIEVMLMPINEIDETFLQEAKAVIFGSPTYYANISWKIKKWFDESRKYNLEGKLGGVFVTGDYIGGGTDTALLTLINHLMVKGMLVYSGGSALGHPYIHLGVVTIKDGDEAQRNKAKIFGERIGKKVLDLFA